MGRTKRKTFHDAGISTPKDLTEINDQGGILYTVPRSTFAISESTNLLFTNKVVEGVATRVVIADGGVRPGTTR